MCQGDGVEDGGAVFGVGIGTEEFAEHRFAGDADEDGVVVVAVAVEVAEQGVVGLEAFAEADA